MQNANADKNLNCKVDKCTITLIKPKIGDNLNIIMQGNGGGSGGGTVDQTARDLIQKLNETDTMQNNNYGNSQATDTAIAANVTELQGQVVAANDQLNAANGRISALEGLVSDIQTQLSNVIVDVNVTDGTTGNQTGNQSGGGGGTGNETGNQSGGGNQSGNGSGNGSTGGNVTIPANFQEQLSNYLIRVSS